MFVLIFLSTFQMVLSVSHLFLFFSYGLHLSKGSQSVRSKCQTNFQRIEYDQSKIHAGNSKQEKKIRTFGHGRCSLHRENEAVSTMHVWVYICICISRTFPIAITLAAVLAGQAQRGPSSTQTFFIKCQTAWNSDKKSPCFYAQKTCHLPRYVCLQKGHEVKSRLASLTVVSIFSRPRSETRESPLATPIPPLVAYP